jgi:hypothetical protein
MRTIHFLLLAAAVGIACSAQQSPSSPSGSSGTSPSRGSGVGDGSSATNGNGLAHGYVTSPTTSKWTASGSTGIIALGAMFKENASTTVCAIASQGAGTC